MEEWQRLLADGVNSVAQLKAEHPEIDPKIAAEIAKKFRIRANRYWMDLAERSGPALLKQILPDERELEDEEDTLEDPLAEDAMSPVPNLTHRYPDRVLFLVCHQCAFYCRYCTRKRKVSNAERISRKNLQQGIDYIAAHPEVRDVILSGGDPLMLKDEELLDVVAKVRAIPHVEIIRIGTRMPSALPQRVTLKLVRALKRFHPIWMMVHFNHPDEVTPEAKACLERLADHGFPLMNQAVLLKGVNDDPDVLKRLFHKLLMARCKPYYLYQADMVKGTDYFRTPVQKGLEIMDALRGWTSGLAVPYYVIDAPGGGGKIPILPNYIVRRSNKQWVIRNYKGEIYRYPEVQVPAASSGFPAELVPADAATPGH